MLSLGYLLRHPRSIQIGDTWFFSSKWPSQRTMDTFCWWLRKQKWFGPFINEDAFGKLSHDQANGRLLTFLYIERLKREYFRAMEGGREPDWVRFLPAEIARCLDKEWAIQGAPNQSRIVPLLPLAGVGYVVFLDGITDQADEVFCLGRLMGVRQLASLHDPTLIGGNFRECPLPFNHTRYVHMLDTMAIAMLIGARCGLSQNDFIHLRVAAQTHDAMTPAGGDSIKVVDPDGLDEDKRYSELFSNPDWPKFRDQYGLQEEKLLAIIAGQGVLRQILDLADKLAYVGRDLWMFLDKNPPGHEASHLFQKEYDWIMHILKIHPYPCSVWGHTRIIDNELVVTSKESLAKFLKVRALMFKILYNNASSRFFEAGFVAELAKVLYNDGTLTKNNLVEMRDEKLFMMMEKALGRPHQYLMSYVSHSEEPRVELFATAEQALQFEQETARVRPNIMTHLDIAPKPSVGCLRTFKVLEKGRVMPFADADPDSTTVIKSIFVDPKPFHVFSYDLGKLCHNQRLTARLLSSRNKRIGL